MPGQSAGQRRAPAQRWRGSDDVDNNWINNNNYEDNQEYVNNNNKENHEGSQVLSAGADVTSDEHRHSVGRTATAATTARSIIR